MRCAIIPNVKIAIVEDDVLVRNFVVNTLEFSVNREVVAFEDGFEALHHISSDNCADIVIADINIPQIDGIELLQKIKKKKPEIICILTSGSSDLEKQASDTGADAFLRKPYTVNDLFKIVQTFVVEKNKETEP